MSAKAESKSKSESKSKTEENYFMEPFQNILAQNFIDSQDMPSINSIQGSISNGIDKLKNAVPDPIKETAKEVAVDAAQSKVAEKLDKADKIVNNPLTKAVAGLMGPDAKKAVDEAGAKIKDS